MAVTDVLPLDEFVDLYKMLDITPDASEAELRERVNKLYLEAQRNIDHHNFRKRFYYQQLYEVHLPQAHQLLLDSTRRVEYNRFLDAFNKGEPFPEDLPDYGATDGDQGGDLGRTTGIETDMLPTMGAAGNAMPSIAASPSTPPTTAPGSAKPVAPAPATPAQPSPVQKVAPTPIAPGPAATPVTPRRAAPVSPSIASSAGRRLAVDIEDMERRRDHKRRELIRGELEAAGQNWGYGAGTLVFIVILAIAYFISGGQPAILGGGAILALTSALIAGRYALRAARRNIVVVLSKMPYDELLRRCAK